MTGYTNPDSPGKTLADLRKESVDPNKDATSTPTEVLEYVPDPLEILPDLEAIFRESIPNLIKVVEEVNPPERVKVIGKLKGALELFNTK